jgi:hypothetical protein
MIFKRGISVRYFRVLFRAFLFAILAGTLTTNAHAQAVSATLLGSINDKTGASIPNAKVTIQEVSTGITPRSHDQRQR